MPDTLGGRYALAPGSAAATLQGELVLGKLTTGECFSLDGSALDMWQVLNEHASMDDAVTALANRFDVPTERLQKDQKAFLEALLEQGLIEYRG